MEENIIRENLYRTAESMMHLKKRSREMRLATEDDEHAAYNRRDSGIDTWDWPQGVGLYGLCCAAKADGVADEKKKVYREFTANWFHDRIEEGLPIRNINTTAPLLALTESGLLDQPEYIKLALEWAEWLMKELPRTEESGFQHVTSGNEQGTTVNLNENQMWVDTLFMAVLFLGRMGVHCGRQDWLDEAVYQMLIHIRYLQDPHTGFLYHGFTFDNRTPFGGIYWCRGDSWFTMAVPMFLENCGDRIPVQDRRIIENAYQAQVKALAGVQSESGLFHTVLNDPETYEEASGTAAIGAGIFAGIRLGILDPSYRKTAERAVEGVISCIGEDGIVGKVSAGTGVGMDVQHYQNIMIAPMAYGQSLTLLCLVESLLTGKES